MPGLPETRFPCAEAASDRLIWIDLEMTGLDPDRDTILEIATVVTDAQLNVLAEGLELAIAQLLPVLEAMDEWNRTHHARSGLWRRVLEEGVPIAEAEARTLAFLHDWCRPTPRRCAAIRSARTAASRTGGCRRWKRISITATST